MITYVIVHLKATRPSFSYRSFSKRAGFSSPNFLKRVAEGERSLSHDSIGRFARGLRLDDAEHAVFEALVQLNQATTDDERNRSYQRLLGLVSRDEVGQMEAGCGLPHDVGADGHCFASLALDLHRDSRG